MTEGQDTSEDTFLTRARDWLRSDVTVKLPGWVFASAGLIAVVLLIVALD